MRSRFEINEPSVNSREPAYFASSVKGCRVGAVARGDDRQARKELSLVPSHPHALRFARSVQAE